MKTLSTRHLAMSVVLGLPALLATPAYALNVLLCNDDGISAANVRALKQALVQASHSVILTAPIDNQSGRGGYIAFLQPVAPLTGNERGAKVLGLAAGTPGVGVDPSDADVHYVNATPVAACLYGIDVQAPLKWGRAPDLVISGPNEGNNTGHINASSGTFNNLVYAINRGLPAMAVSDSASTQVNWTPLLPATHRAHEVATVVMRALDEIFDAKAPRTRHERPRNEPLLPRGLGLNLNVPAFPAGAATTLTFVQTRIGVATAYAPAFYQRLSDSALAAAAGANVALPGVSLAIGGTTLPTGTVVPLDDSTRAEGNVIARGGVVTVSPVRGMPEATSDDAAWVRARLRR